MDGHLRRAAVAGWFVTLALGAAFVGLAVAG